jgi:hypothetical protein
LGEGILRRLKRRLDAADLEILRILARDSDLLPALKGEAFSCNIANHYLKPTAGSSIQAAAFH